MHLKPTPDRRVIDPVSGLPLPESGQKVEPSPYWTRRLNDGDVIEFKPSKRTEPK